MLIMKLKYETYLLFIFLKWLNLGHAGLTWDILTTICPHQMAAEGFEPMTLGFLRFAPYDLRHLKCFRDC